jgi:long-chain acyl-CoA synthetase
VPPSHSDVATFGSLLDILDDAMVRRPDQPALGIRGDDGVAWHWTYREFDRRSKLAAFRLHALGLQPGERLITWSPSSPELPAVYFGAMRARLVVVPLDLRMAPDTVARILAGSGARFGVLGTGRDAPDPRGSGLDDLPLTTTSDLTADPAPDPSDPARLPADWEAQVDAWARPAREDMFEVVYTSGTTGVPKGVMLTHGAILSSIDAFGLVIPPMEHRVVSLLPLSHLMEQAAALFYATLVGADILYIRSRNPRVIFEAIRDHGVTTLLVVPAILELFWTALTREVDRRGQREQFERARRMSRRLPYWARRLVFRSVHRQFGGGLRLAVTAGAYLPPALQQAWEDLGVVILQGYGATECGIVACSTLHDHAPGTVGRVPSPSSIRVRLADDGEILVAGPTLFAGYWGAAEARASGVDGDGWYHTGDVARFDERGNLVLQGRTRNVIVLPNGFNVFPEDVENVLHDAGLTETVVLETEPGRIEAIVLPPERAAMVLAPDASGAARFAGDDAELTARIDAAVHEANAHLAIHQRIAGWRLWPGTDFPRTHTFKVRRDEVQAWAAAEAPLPLVHSEGR